MKEKIKKGYGEAKPNSFVKKILVHGLKVVEGGDKRGKSIFMYPNSPQPSCRNDKNKVYASIAMRGTPLTTSVRSYFGSKLKGRIRKKMLPNGC